MHRSMILMGIIAVTIVGSTAPAQTPPMAPGEYAQRPASPGAWIPLSDAAGILVREGMGPYEDPYGAYGQIMIRRGSDWYQVQMQNSIFGRPSDPVPSMPHPSLSRD